MTIAELLVQTEATVFVAYVPHLFALAPENEVAWKAAYQSAADEARRIVAAIYGEPCRGLDSGWYASAPWREAKVEEVLPDTRAPQPSDECGICGWPRSQHKSNADA